MKISNVPASVFTFSKFRPANLSLFISSKLEGSAKYVTMDEEILGPIPGIFWISLSDDLNARDDFGPFVPGIELVPFNDLDALESVFSEKGDRIAAYLVEPIQGEAGVIIPDDDYWTGVSNLCKKYNILLAMDEVQTGFGRTGANFALLQSTHQSLM